VSRHRKPKRQDRLTGAVKYAAVAACGMTFNDLSGTLGYRGLADVFAVLAVVVAAAGVRGMDQRTRLARLGPWPFLALAAAAAIGAAAGPEPWPKTLTTGAVSLATGGALVASGLKAAAELLGRTTLAGLALIFCRAGVLSMLNQNAPVGIALLLTALAFAATSLLLTTDREALLGAAAISLGLAFVSLAVALHAEPHPRLSVALAGIGIGLISLGLASLPRGETASFVVVIAGGTVVAGSGAEVMARQQEALAGGAILVLGASLVVIGAACLAGRQAAGYVAVILTGALVVAGGVPWHSGRQVLLLAPVMIGGIAVIMYGMAETDPAGIAAGIYWFTVPPGRPPAKHRKR
jgi:hypothetical protein